jgi:hypothetical protein
MEEIGRKAMQSRDAFIGEETVLLPLFLKKRIKEKMMITKLKFCFLILSSWLGKNKFFLLYSIE